VTIAIALIVAAGIDRALCGSDVIAALVERRWAAVGLALALLVRLGLRAFVLFVGPAWLGYVAARGLIRTAQRRPG
jgi:hypothetical protein